MEWRESVKGRKMNSRFSRAFEYQNGRGISRDFRREKKREEGEEIGCSNGCPPPPSELKSICPDRRTELSPTGRVFIHPSIGSIPKIFLRIPHYVHG